MTGIKRMLAVLLAAVMLMILMPDVEARADSSSYGLIYGTATLNLRAQPSSSATWLGAYDAGQWVEITGVSGNWYSVITSDGKKGYMSRNFVSVAAQTVANVGIVSNQKPSAFLNLRTTPSYSASVAGIYYNGAPCLVLSESNGWVHVNINFVDGYFRREYLTIRPQIYAQAAGTVITPNLGSLNVRSGPGAGYSVLRHLKGGSYVMIMQTGSKWMQVVADDCVGFVDSQYIRPQLLSPSEARKAAEEAFGPVTPVIGAYAIVTNPKATQVLNLRERPDTTSKSIGQFRNGAKLSVLSQGTEWCKVQSQTGVVGYMMTKYLTLFNLPVTPQRMVVHPQQTYVNLRTMPSSYAAIITHVPHGASVTVLTPGDSWIKVRYNGMIGYMSAQFLK